MILSAWTAMEGMQHPKRTQQRIRLHCTTAVDELLAALRWLGSGVIQVLPAIEALLADNAEGRGALSRTQLEELGIILASAGGSATVG